MRGRWSGLAELSGGAVWQRSAHARAVAGVWLVEARSPRREGDVKVSAANGWWGNRAVGRRHFAHRRWGENRSEQAEVLG